MDQPDNRVLVDAIQRVRDTSGGDGELLRSMLQELLKSTLLVGHDDEPTVVETDDGELLLALFTDQVELHFFDPGCPTTTIDAVQAIRLVAEEEYDGLVVNPGTRQFELSREDVLDFFDID